MAEAAAADQEPTMEEILASIRRIISEDDEPGAEAAPEADAEAAEETAAEPAAVPEPAAEEPEAEAEPEVAAAPEPEPEPEPVAEVEDDIVAEPVDEVLELTERVEEEALEVDDLVIDEVEPEPAPAPEPPAAEAEEDLVSGPVAEAAASAFGDLVGQMLVSSRSTEGKTLEDIVRELMKPMLKEWLDSNLTGIVEATVADEVQKIASRARR